MMDNYTEKLKIADDKIMKRFHKATQKFDRVLQLGVISSVLIFIISFGVLAISLSYVIYSERDDPISQVIGIGGTLVSLAILVVILTRNPLKLIRTTVADMVKMNVIFMGYVRQVDQIDMTFKVLFEKNGADLASMEKTVSQLRQAVDQTIDNVSRALEEFDGTTG